MQQAGQNTGGPVCVADPNASNHVTADNVFADRPSPSRQLRGLIWLSLLLRTTETEIERLGDAFFELTFSFISNLSAFTHSLLHIFICKRKSFLTKRESISYIYFSCTTASRPSFSALNCRTPPPFSITISAFTRQHCRTHPASTHFEWRTLQHPEEGVIGWILNKDKDAFRNYFSCKNCNFRN